MTRWITGAAAGVLFTVALGTSAFSAPEELSIMAPAGPGGGWDQTARSMQQAIQAAAIVKNVQVTNVPGAGGTIGIALVACGGAKYDRENESGWAHCGANVWGGREPGKRECAAARCP